MKTQTPKICAPVLAAWLCLGLSSTARAQDDGWEDFAPSAPPPVSEADPSSPPTAPPEPGPAPESSAGEAVETPPSTPQVDDDAGPSKVPDVVEPPASQAGEPDSSPQGDAPAPAAEPDSKEKTDAAKAGADPVVVVAAQYATACLAPSLGCLVSWVPFVGQLAWVVMPALTGWFVQLVGDKLGNTKTTVLPSIIGSYIGSFCISGPCMVAGGVVAYLSFAGGFYGASVSDRPEPLLLFGLGLGVAGCAGLVGQAVGAAVPVLAYQMFGDEEIGAVDEDAGFEDSEPVDDPATTTPIGGAGEGRLSGALAY